MLDWVHMASAALFSFAALGFLLRARSVARLALIPLCLGSASWHVLLLLGIGGIGAQFVEIIRYGALISSMMFLVGPAMSSVARRTGHGSWVLGLLLVWGDRTPKDALQVAIAEAYGHA